MSYSTIKNHFRAVDSIIYPFIKQVDFATRIKPRRPNQYFTSLCSTIIGQQLSGKAADTIEKRFLDLFSTSPKPQEILKLSDQQLRDVGLSWAKVKYIQDLSTKVTTHALDLRTIEYVSDQEVIAKLTQVKGIGPWTAEMFLMFTLGREDIFSHGDLGLRKAIQNLYQLPDPTVDTINLIVDKWSPYKTYGSLALWHSLDNR